MSSLVYSKDTTIGLLTKLCINLDYKVKVEKHAVLITPFGSKEPSVFTTELDALLSLEDLSYTVKANLTTKEIEYFNTLKSVILSGAYKEQGMSQ